MMHLMKLKEHLEDSKEKENSQKLQPANQLEVSDNSQDPEWVKNVGLSLPSGAQLQLNSVPTGIVEKVSLFFCCCQCGKIFWEGSHFGRVVSQFKEVLHDQGEHFFYQSDSQGL
uniref:Mut7-C RNAse domain-containing protein n=2 Tax=Pyxicephalus adspersus TaxID=30357 RepID=A0AAV3A2J0_PYXAD|nr:TPA: hypothetical protein GDO54_017958 [Pyxicephalus adspersus]